MSGETQLTGLPGLRVAREAKLLTQQELADAAGLSRTTVTELEAGVRNAHIRTIRRLATALRIPAQELLASATPVRRRRPRRGPALDGARVPEEKGA